MCELLPFALGQHPQQRPNGGMKAFNVNMVDLACQDLGSSKKSAPCELILICEAGKQHQRTAQIWPLLKGLLESLRE